MVKSTWSCPRMLFKIVSLGLNIVTWHFTRKTPSVSKGSHSLPRQLLHPIGRASLWHMSSKLNELVLTPWKCREPLSRNLTILVFSRYIKILDYIWINHVLCNKIIDSFISNMVQSSNHLAYWKKVTFPYSWSKFHNIGVKLKSAHSRYKKNTISSETMMHSSIPWAP